MNSLIFILSSINFKSSELKELALATCLLELLLALANLKLLSAKILSTIFIFFLQNKSLEKEILFLLEI